MSNDTHSVRPGPGPGDPSPDLVFVIPALTELSSLIGSGALRADSEQQQQQQQQQQHNSVRRRFLNLETSLPEEEVVSKLAVEIRQFNKIAPRTK